MDLDAAWIRIKKTVIINTTEEIENNTTIKNKPLKAEEIQISEKVII